MGEIGAKLVLENQRDRILAEAGHLDNARIRRVEVDTLVDNGALMTLLPSGRVAVLGLPVDGKMIVTLANEEKIELPRAVSCRSRSGIDRWTPTASWGRRDASRCSARSCSNAST